MKKEFEMTERLSELFEKQVDLNPDAVCVIHGNRHFTFGEIEEYANKIANWLIEKSVKPNDIIAILVDNPVNFYIIMLGTLKAGAAYLPLDPGYPVKRIEYILNDAPIKLFITSKNIFKEDILPIEKVVQFEKIKPVLITQSSARPVLKDFSHDNLCYVIYTSGTTGTPKGIAIPNDAAINYVKGASKLYGVTKNDRVYQGFKVAFDASIEEIWMAFANGATLISSASREVKEGAALIDFLNFHRITFFSTVPTLLAMLTPDIPTLKILVLGGEVCSKELIAPWIREGLRIFNTYGPSEATIIATCLECKKDAPVTLGKAIPNCDICILDKNLQRVPDGKEGELCIGGLGLALQYINNPEMTEKKFIIPPFTDKRYYRSGDLAFINKQGEIEYKGRIDEQVKLRGYRIEIGEIEAQINADKNVSNSAVVVHEFGTGMQFLVAYIIPKKEAVLDIEKLKKNLQAILPFYMIPSLFEIVQNFPVLPSGKVDKKSFQKPQLSHILDENKYVPPETEMEKKITKIWEDVLKIAPISVESHFFKHLGGHSLAAAKIVSAMRADKTLQNVSMVDIFENATIRKLSKIMEKIIKANMKAKEAEEKNNAENLLGKMQKWICFSLQALISMALIVLPTWYFCLVLLMALTLTLIMTNMSFLSMLPYWIAFLILLEPALITLGIVLKWVLLGRIKPGKYKLWGWYYLRWWIVKQVQDLASVEYLIGSPFIIFYYRLMGVKIGKNCYIGTDQLDSYDLVSIGDNTSLCSDVIASGYKVEDGWLKIGSIKIGKNCFVGANSVLSLNTKIENGGKLGEQSMLSEGSTIPENETFIGSPGKPGVFDLYMPILNQKVSNKLLIYFCNFLLLVLIDLIYFCAVLPGIALLVIVNEQYNLMHLAWAIPVAAMSSLFLLVLQIFIFKKIFGPIKKGIYSLNSIAYLKIWFTDRLMALALKTLEPLYGTIFSASCFRLLGAKIGKNSELSTVNFTFPEMLHIGKDSFIADSSILAPARIYQGYYSIAPVYLGNRVFVGNSALLSGNTVIGDNCLIGCVTLSPKSVPSGTNWIGTPALFLQQREAHGKFGENETYSPPLVAKIARGIVECFKIFLPSFFLFFILALDIMTFIHLLENFSFLISILVFPFFSIVYTVLVVNIIIVLKWLLIGKYKKTEIAMWHPYVWCSELITSLYDTVIVPYFLEALTGSPLISPFLRNLGVKVGKDVFINTPYFSEFDLVTIMDEVSLNRECIMQTHLYEDRIFKMSSITLESHVSVGDRSILLYGTLMKTYSTLDNLSLLMKGETLYPHSHWEGVPAKRLYRSPLQRLG